MKGIINEKGEKIKKKIVQNVSNLIDSAKVFFFKKETFFILVVIFTSSVSFFLGKISMIHQWERENKQDILVHKSFGQDTELVASQKGSTYHFPWCSGAVRMSEENKISFANRQEAEEAGYRPAKNCEGL